MTILEMPWLGNGRNRYGIAKWQDQPNLRLFGFVSFLLPLGSMPEVSSE